MLFLLPRMIGRQSAPNLMLHVTSAFSANPGPSLFSNSDLLPENSTRYSSSEQYYLKFWQLIEEGISYRDMQKLKVRALPRSSVIIVSLTTHTRVFPLMQ